MRSGIRVAVIRAEFGEVRKFLRLRAHSYSPGSMLPNHCRSRNSAMLQIIPTVSTNQLFLVKGIAMPPPMLAPAAKADRNGPVLLAPYENEAEPNTNIASPATIKSTLEV